MKYDEIIKIKKRFLEAGCQSADIYDGMEILGLHDQCLDLSIKPFYDNMTIVGPAFTYFGTREPRYDEDLPIPAVDKYAQFERMYPGCVVVLNAEGDHIVGHFGEFMCWGAHNRGAVGCVIDGGCRDKRNIGKIPEWGLFAKYASPIESKRRWRPRMVEEPIFMSGATHNYVRVNPGDWLFGDSDGVIVMPKEALLDILHESEKIAHAESIVREALKKGAPFAETMYAHNRF